MRLQISIEGHTIVCTVKQFEALAEVVSRCERVSSTYTGSVAGKSQYLNLLENADVTDVMRAKPMTEDAYKAMQMVTKLRNEGEKS